MSKELTPLEALEEIGKLKESGEYINTTVEYKIVETALKALEIIKEKVGIHWNELLQLWLKTKLINKEQHDLLKEVLK